MAMVLRALLLTAAAAVAAAGMAACGGGEAPEPQPTPRSSSADRVQREEQQGAAEQQAAPAAAEQADQSIGADDGADAAMVGATLTEGRRAGVFALRNSIGDPDANVVIVEYSDFL